MTVTLYNDMQKHVVGQRIKNVRLNRVHLGPGFDWSYRPVILLENGVSLHFMPEEGDALDGVHPIIRVSKGGKK